ncbi:MAG: cupin domain-containing protein [Chloroflexota bacterium]|nr:cupin domain-containing protein [Chloroflexia bacterium]MDQ3225661.1 cupin domain-containing protein [Chloroflexota bacterium]
MTTEGVLGRFDLGAEIDRFPPGVPSGRRSETLLKTPRLRVVLVTMRAGTELREHTAPGVITVQPLQGRFAFMTDGGEREIAAGTLIALEANTRHAVRAIEDGAFLLTIAWPDDARDAAIPSHESGET